MPYLIVTGIPAHHAVDRDAARPDHLAYLEGAAQVILAAGAKLADDGSVGDGSFYLVDVETHAEAMAFIEGDPYFERGLIEDLTLTRVRTGFYDRRRRPT